MGEVGNRVLNALSGFVRVTIAAVSTFFRNVGAVFKSKVAQNNERAKINITSTPRYNATECIPKNNQFHRNHDTYVTSDILQNQHLHRSDSQKNYRSIPVLPTALDILHPCTFLRPSIIKGQYQNTEHYLDIQYRLLREDFVRPLREGIAEYLTLKDSNQSLKQLQDITIYPDVRIRKQEFVNNEWIHLFHIKDKRFANIKWESCKRLLYKSLLCLSSDNFKTMHFATVAKRDPEDLTKGLLFLRFEELTDKVLNIDPSRKFVAIENSAYFEAYRYTLEALHEIKDSTLPMKRYIVETQKNVLKPHYLKSTVNYDMRPVLIPLSDASKRRDIYLNGKIFSDYIYPNDTPKWLKNVNVVNESLWPTCSDLNLDPSQYAALKAAITKEFAIIQGPPGTGKTYVGLRIAQVLLHNADKWQTAFNPSPILVICSTNHALDQFLEGILIFTKKIVRIGGGGTNDAISSFQISNLKKNMIQNKELPHDIFCRIKEKRHQLRNLINSLEKTKQSFETSYTSVFSKTNKNIAALHQLIRIKYNELQEIRTQEDTYICKKALVVGMTTTGAAKYRHLVQNLNPQIVIIEEAAEILESHIVTSLARGTQHLILIGDHQQLRPIPTVHLLATKYGMNISLFERMVVNGLDCHQLEIQHRMRPEIASLLVPHIYPKLKNHESVKTFENIKGLAKNVFFVNHSYSELQEKDSKSKANRHEAIFILKLCKYLIMQGYEHSQITVLSTYSGQLSELSESPLKKALPGVRFTSVDNYQGEENDIILISFVRSNNEGQIGFLKESNRVCVALSRARKGLYCIGNFTLFSEKSILWKNIIKTLRHNQAIGPSLPLVCENHRDIVISVTNDTDFDSILKSGCRRPCEFRLLCGHQCPLKCHLNDPKHENIQCPKPCAKRCREGHLCTLKCYENCPPCDFPVRKKLELCGHTLQVPCYRLKKVTPCTEPCEKLLPCGHQKCSRKCGESCLKDCFVKVLIKSPVCNHELNIECSKSKDLEFMMRKCKEPCEAELPCGHKCQGKCGDCFQGRLHVICTRPCIRKLICGHRCKSLCYINCPPCEETCQKFCVHKKCSRKCGDPCEICTEPCEWACSHKKCTRLCGQLCNRTLCNKPCRKKLICKHTCIGVCGEPCPTKCRTCDKEEVEEGWFGCQVKTDSMFVRLKDCEHIFEVNALRKWMNQESSERNEIRLKACPICNTVIRNTLYFETNTESFVENIEKIKDAVSQNKGYNNKLKEVLCQRIRTEQTGSSLGLTSSSTFCTNWMKLKKALESQQSRDIQELCSIENVMNIMKIWLSCSASRLCEFLICHNVFQHLNNKEKVEKLKDYIRVTEKWLDSFIAKIFLIASEQQLKDLMWEVHRLKLVDELCRLLLMLHGRGEPFTLMDKLALLVLTYSPFRETQLRECISELQNVSKYILNSSIDIYELQKQPVLKIMSFSSGHWFWCEMGHVYSVVKCCSTTRESKCYECDRKIIYMKPLTLKQPMRHQEHLIQNSKGCYLS